MRRFAALGYVFTWCAAWNAAGLYAAQPADGIPSSASVAIRFKAPQATVDKVADFVDAVQPGFGIVVRDNLPNMGQAIGNPGLGGVDTAQDVWVVVFAQPQEPPTVVFVVTAEDVDDVKDALPANFEVYTTGKIVAYSEDADALAEVQKGLEGEGKALLTTIDAPSRKTFDGLDLAVLVNVKQLTEDFSDELDSAEPQLNMLIDNLIETLPEAQRPTLAPALGIYRALGAALIRGVRDSNSLVLGVAVSKTSIRYEDRLQVTAGTPTSKFLASQKPGDLALISKLPADKPAYFGMKADMSNMMAWSMNLTKEMLGESAATNAEEFDAAVAEMSKLKFDELVMFMDVGVEAPALRAGGVTVVTPASKLREISHKMIKMMGEIKTPAFTQKTTLEVNAEKIGGFNVDRVTIEQEFDESSDPLGMQKKVHAVMFGEGGMQQRIVYQDKENRTLQTIGGKAEMEDLLTSLAATGSKDATLAAARKKFPAQANVLVLFDIPRLAMRGIKLAADQGADLPFNVDVLDDLKLENSFIGYSLVCEPTAVRAQLEIPLEQIQNIMRLQMALRGQ